MTLCLKRSVLVVVLTVLALAGCGPRDGRPPLTLKANSKLTVTFLDVGQGDCALVRFPDEKTMLIDGGPPSAGRIVRERLGQLGIKSLDWVVATHPHADHIGGLVDALRQAPACTAIDSGFQTASPALAEYLSVLRSGGTEISVVPETGLEFQPTSDTRVSVLAPTKRIEGAEDDANNNSVVLRIEHGKVRFLFTGDMQELERKVLYVSQGRSLMADVLKVAHHGSQKGTDTDFLLAVRATTAVISCAEGNEYGHPHRATLEALARFKVRTYRTDKHGDITVTSDGRAYEIVPARQAPTDALFHPRTVGANFAGPVIGNRRSRSVHSPTCDNLPSPRLQVPMGSLVEAESRGFRPHGKCIR